MQQTFPQICRQPSRTSGPDQKCRCDAMHIVCELADIADDNTESIIRHSFRNDADDESSNGAARAVERTCQQRRLRND